MLINGSAHLETAAGCLKSARRVGTREGGISAAISVLCGLQLVLRQIWPLMPALRVPGLSPEQESGLEIMYAGTEEMLPCLGLLSSLHRTGSLLFFKHGPRGHTHTSICRQ